MLDLIEEPFEQISRLIGLLLGQDIHGLRSLTADEANDPELTFAWDEF